MLMMVMWSGMMKTSVVSRTQEDAKSLRRKVSAKNPVRPAEKYILVETPTMRRRAGRGVAMFGFGRLWIVRVL